MLQLLCQLNLNGILFAMDLRITTSQTQKQVLSPAMHQSIEILMLPIADLNTSIEQELQNNPMLEVDPPNAIVGQSPQIGSVDMFPRINEPASRSESFFDEETQPEFPIIQNTSLEEHLLTQLRVEINEPTERNIGEIIIGNLDADGYLSTPVDEIAWLAKTTDIAKIEQVLKTIQQFDPVGIASRDIKECLINQALVLDTAIRGLVLTILRDHFEELFQKKFDLIAKKINSTFEKVSRVAQLIGTLEPKPARKFQNGEQTIYVQPDIFLIKDMDGNFKIEINKKETPSVRINPTYLKLLKDPHTSSQDRKFIQKKLTNALNFIKSIELRGETLKQIGILILERQRPFFEGGSSCLSPMALKDIASILERNESTISRAVNNKHIQTPQGMFPLRFFFSNAVNNNNIDVSAHNIKLEIKHIIDSEDKKCPRTDQELLEFFQAKGIKMARRTINKYRQELKIPSSYLRRKS